MIDYSQEEPFALGQIQQPQQGPDYSQLENQAFQRYAQGAQQAYATPPPQYKAPTFGTKDIFFGLLPAFLDSRHGLDYIANYLQGKFQGADQGYQRQHQQYQETQNQRLGQAKGDLATAQFYGKQEQAQSADKTKMAIAKMAQDGRLTIQQYRTLMALAPEARAQWLATVIGNTNPDAAKAVSTPTPKENLQNSQTKGNDFKLTVLGPLEKQKFIDNHLESQANVAFTGAKTKTEDQTRAGKVTKMADDHNLAGSLMTYRRVMGELRGKEYAHRLNQDASDLAISFRRVAAYEKQVANGTGNPRMADDISKILSDVDGKIEKAKSDQDGINYESAQLLPDPKNPQDDDFSPDKVKRRQKLSDAAMAAHAVQVGLQKKRDQLAKLQKDIQSRGINVGQPPSGGPPVPFDPMAKLHGPVGGGNPNVPKRGRPALKLPPGWKQEGG